MMFVKALPVAVLIGLAVLLPIQVLGFVLIASGLGLADWTVLSYPLASSGHLLRPLAPLPGISVRPPLTQWC